MTLVPTEGFTDRTLYNSVSICTEKNEPSWLNQILRRPASKVGPWLESGNLGFREVPIIPYLVTVAYCSLFLNPSWKQLVYIEHLLSFGESRILTHDQPPVKALDANYLTSFPPWQCFTCIVIIFVGGVKHPCNSTGRILLETCPMSLFSLLDYALWSFSVIRHSHKWQYAQSRESS